MNQRLITGDESLDGNIIIDESYYASRPAQDYSQKKDPDEDSGPGIMREDVEAYQAAKKRQEAEKRRKQQEAEAAYLATVNSWKGVSAPQKAESKVEELPQAEPKQAEVPKPEPPKPAEEENEFYLEGLEPLVGQQQSKAKAPVLQEKLEEDEPQEIEINEPIHKPKVQIVRNDILTEGPTVDWGNDMETNRPRHGNPKKKQAKKKAQQGARIEEVQGPQNEVANLGFQPQPLGPRTKFGAIQKAGNLAGSAFSAVLTTGVNLAISPFMAPFVGAAEGNAAFVSKYGQQSRRHDLIPGWRGAKFENPDASGEEILSDIRRVPTIWSKATAEKAENEDGSPKAPEITVYVNPPNFGSSRTNSSHGSGHTFLGLRYTRRSPLSERNERYELIYGFYPSDDYGTQAGAAMVTKNVRIPGQLHNDAASPFKISRRFPATNAQVNAIVKASETYADKGYNVFERNCTTFVSEMIQDHAHLNTGGKIFEEEEMRFSAVDNTMRGGLGLFTPGLDISTLNKMADNAKEADPSYAGYGNMKVTKDEIQRYKKSRDYFRTVKKGYTPAVAGENIRRLHGENNGVLGSYYYYGNLNIKLPDDPKDSPDASDVSDVALNELEIELVQTHNALSKAVISILPPELQQMKNDERPANLRDFLNAVGFSSEPVSNLMADMDDARRKAPKDKKKEDPEYYVTLDQLKTAYTDLQNRQARISRGFSQIFQGDARVETQVMNLLSIITITLRSINDLYQNKYLSNQKKTADLGDIRSEMTKTFGLEEKGKIAMFTPTRYEAYLAIYRKPAEAILAYARLEELREAEEEETITKAEKEELKKLEEIDSTATTYCTSHEYLLQKDNYNQQDLDYIFKLKAREKRGLDNKNMRRFNDGDSAAGIYQSLVLDKIFAGLKAAYLKDVDPKTFKEMSVMENWVADYTAECAWSHAKELEMIIRAIRRVSKRHTEKSIFEYVTALVSTMYIARVFPNSQDDKLKLAHRIMPSAFENVMIEGTKGFPVRVRALIQKVLKEKP